MIPLGTNPTTDEMREEGRRLLAAGLGEAELRQIALYTAPLFWHLRTDCGDRFKNGSTFFLDAGQGVFGVTAGHVIEQCFRDCRSDAFQRCIIGARQQYLPVDLTKRIIDGNSDLDIATYRISREEVESLGYSVMTGYQREWPPVLPTRGSTVGYGGFPGVDRIFTPPRQIDFKSLVATGAATNVHEDCISIQHERDKWVLGFGDALPPENYNYGGISGGPLITLIETNVLRSYIPAGVIFAGPNPSQDEAEAIAGFEVIRVRPIQYIKPDGTLDNDRWAMDNFHRDIR